MEETEREISGIDYAVLELRYKRCVVWGEDKLKLIQVDSKQERSSVHLNVFL